MPFHLRTPIPPRPDIRTGHDLNYPIVSDTNLVVLVDEDVGRFERPVDDFLLDEMYRGQRSGEDMKMKRQDGEGFTEARTWRNGNKYAYRM